MEKGIENEIKSESIIPTGHIHEYKAPFGWGYKFTTSMRITEENQDKIFEYVINTLREQVKEDIDNKKVL